MATEILSGRAVFEKLEKRLMGQGKPESPEYVSILQQIPRTFLSLLHDGAVQAFHDQKGLEFRGIFTAYTPDGGISDMYYRVGDLRMVLGQATGDISPRSIDTVLEAFDAVARKVAGSAPEKDFHVVSGYGRDVFVGEDAAQEDAAPPAARSFKPGRCMAPV